MIDLDAAARRASGCWWSPGARTPAREYALDEPLVTGGPPPRQRHLPGRHHRVPPPRRGARRSPTGYEVPTSGSLNGTYLNRERVEQATLTDGDELQIGTFKLLFLAGRA